MSFDRSKFAGTKVSAIKKQEKEFDKKMDFGKGRNKNAFLKLKEGKNKIRIFPAHPNTPSFYQPCVVHFLPILSEWENKDGKKQSEVKRKPVFSGKQHSAIGMCPIDSYIHHVYKVAANEYQDKDDREKFVSPIKGREGITGSTSYIAYAKMDGDFGRIQLKTSIKNALNEIAVGQDEEDGVISTDPFSDPDTGSCVIVTYNKQEDLPKAKRKPEDYYKTAIDLKGATPLTDDELKELLECKSLEELYVDSYTRKDFDMAVDGLKRFDDEHKLGIFAIDDFLDTLEEIADKLPEVEEESDDNSQKEEEKPKRSTRKPEVKKEEDEPSDLPFDKAYDDMDRSELEGVVRRNKLPIRITSRLSNEDLLDWVKEEMSINEATEEAAEKEAKEQDEDKSSRSSRRGGSGSRLSALQDELGD